MTLEIKNAVDELGAAFEEFKAANDQRLAEIEATGAADAVTVDKVEKINAKLGELSAEIETAGKQSTATDDRLDDIELAMSRAKIRPGGGNGADLAASAQAFLAARDNKPDRELAAGELEAYAEYGPAFTAYLRRGQTAVAQYQAALSVGSDPDGGYWVPTETVSRVTTRLFESSAMRQIANVMSIGSDALEIPNDSNTGVSGGWVGETASRPETNTSQIGVLRIPTHEQYANPKTSQKLLDDAVIDVGGWLEMKIADILARTENAAFTTGDGSGKPRGFLDYGAASVTTADATRAWGVLQYTASGGAGAFAATDPGDNLIDLVHTLNPAYRTGAAWLMNRATAGEARKLKDGNGNYLWSANFQAGQPASLLGFNVVEGEDMPDIAADSFSIAFGDFRQGYVIVDRVGIRTLRDPFTDKPNVLFYTTKRVGGDVENYDAIKLFKFAAS